MRLEVIDNHRSRFAPVPVGWHQRKMRFAVAHYQTEKNRDENPTVLSLTKTGLKVKTDLAFGKSTENYVGHQIVKAGQFVFTPRDFDATPILCGVADTEGCISNLYIVFDVHPQIYGRFLEYYFWGLKFGFGFFEKLSFGMRYSFNRTQFENIPLLYPAPETQKAIADFLDRETARIDQLIEKKQRLVAVLKERLLTELERLTTATEPLHSELVPFRWVCRITEGQVDPTAPEWADKPLIAPNHIASRTGRLIEIETAEDQGAISGKYAFPAGTVLYSKIRPNLAKACVSPVAGMCSADMYPILPHKSLRSQFLLMQLLSAKFTDWATLESMRVAMPKINRETLGGYRFWVPALSIQDEAIKCFSAEREAVEQLSDKVSESIVQMREFRSALITSAVTGQIDVATWGKHGLTDRRLDQIQEAMGV